MVPAYYPALRAKIGMQETEPYSILIKIVLMICQTPYYVLYKEDLPRVQQKSQEGSTRLTCSVSHKKRGYRALRDSPKAPGVRHRMHACPSGTLLGALPLSLMLSAEC